MEYSNIILESHDHYASITLNRPDKLNAISYELLSELGRAIDAINGMFEVRVLVIKGAGRAFSSGTDLQGLGSGKIDRTRPGYRYHLGQYQEAYNKIERLEKPVIAQIHGYALGGAMELALACDFRIATKDTRFALPEVIYGIIPDLGGCQRLVRAVGLLKAKELVMMGRTIDGTEAERIGFINRAVEPEALEGEVRKWADELTALPPLAVGLGKRMVDKALDMDILTSLDVNAQTQSMLIKTEDFTEAMRARVEKRSPRFKGE